MEQLLIINVFWKTYKNENMNENKRGKGTFRHQIISALRRFGTKAFLVYYHIQKLVRVLQWLKH